MGGEGGVDVWEGDVGIEFEILRDVEDAMARRRAARRGWVLLCGFLCCGEVCDVVGDVL